MTNVFDQLEGDESNFQNEKIINKAIVKACQVYASSIAADKIATI